MDIVVGALLIGLSLGLLGSGGSILTVPALVYLLGHDEKAAIAESLAIVGAIALVGALPYARSRQVNWQNVLFFGVPGMAGTWGGAWLSQYVAGSAQLMLFAVVMLLAAWMMFRRSTSDGPHLPVGSGGLREAVPQLQHAWWKIVLEGLAVGVLTGLVGVGGGFLIVPALVVLGRLPMRIAVATSLPIIALKSGSGFLKYLGVLQTQNLTIDWGTVGLFVLLGAVGSVAGHRIGDAINQQVLRRVFAVFLVGMGLFVLAKEAPRAFGGGWGRNVAVTVDHPAFSSQIISSAEGHYHGGHPSSVGQ